MAVNCTHCNSPYTRSDKQYINTSGNEATSIVSRHYCESCKKYFETKRPTHGTWLFTVEETSYCTNKLRVFKNEYGFFCEYDEGYKASIFSAPVCAVVTERYGSAFLHFIFCSSGISADKVFLNPEFTKIALENPAMKAVHVQDNEFSAAINGVTALLKDVANWFHQYPLAGAGKPASGNGCYVATAVYGSYDCPEVWTLRRFRDDTLAASLFGRAFIRTYYAISPTLVKWFGNTSWFKNMWKPKLDKLVEKLQAKGVESTPYNDRNW